MNVYIHMTNTTIKLDFKAAKEYFESNSIDLAICDHFSDACYSAAELLNIPYIVTSTLPITKGMCNVNLHDFTVY